MGSDTTRPPTVEVVTFKPVQTASTVKAYASVRLGGVIIHDFKVIQQPGQKPWVASPQREYTVNGKRHYAAIVELSEALKERVTALVLEEWWREGNHGTQR
jgi:DNA-binding cell septation regulator SpoVG